jgi:cystathionine beta-synthase
MDDAETVSDKEAFEVLQIILKEEGILGGSSSGTIVAAAAKWCRKQTEPQKPLYQRQFLHHPLRRY